MSNTTLAQVASMPDETWINDPVQCLLTIVKQGTSKSGRPYWNTELTDPNDPSCQPVSAAFFADPARYNGQIVEIGGKGNRKGSYSGKAQINIGKTGIVKVIGASNSSATQQAPAPPPTHPARTAPVNTVNGQSIGMAVKEAHLSILKSGEALTEDAIVEKAGIFLRASSRLERGEHMQQSSQQRLRPQPGPGGSVKVEESDFNEVPF